MVQSNEKDPPQKREEIEKSKKAPPPREAQGAGSKKGSISRKA